MAALAEQAGVRPGDILGHDLFTYLSQPPARFGLRNEFFASSRLDNLSSTHAGLTAIEDLGDGDDLVVLAAFDHEEIGSATSSGAAGPFLEDVLERIASIARCDLDATKALLGFEAAEHGFVGSVLSELHQELAVVLRVPETPTVGDLQSGAAGGGEHADRVLPHHG